MGPLPVSVLPALLVFILPSLPSPPCPTLGLLGLASSALERFPPQAFLLPLPGLWSFTLSVLLPQQRFTEFLLSSRPGRGGRGKGEGGRGVGVAGPQGPALRSLSARVEARYWEVFQGSGPGDELPADLLPSEGLLLRLQMAVFLLCPPWAGWGGGGAGGVGRERKKKLSGLSL